MKNRIKNIIIEAAREAFEGGDFPSDIFPEVELEKTKNIEHGDFSTNFAMQMARAQKMSPRKIAEILISRIPETEDLFGNVEIAGPGFVNFFIRPVHWYPVISKVFNEAESYGASTIGAGTRVQVEFVSANPTGPLHVGHGRGAVVGDTVARVLEFCGFDVQREYYVNDAGNQIRTLGLSVYLRAVEATGKTIEFPETCYQGGYIKDIATRVTEGPAPDLLERSEEDAIAFCSKYAADEILGGIRDDLLSFGICYDEWFSEKSLYESGRVDGAITDLKERGIIYEKDGASWFNTSDHGDDKDRIVIKSDGITTYFASDIAYHQDKYARGFDRVIDVWGADHHGYITRINAAIEACGHDSDNFDVILVQLVNLLRDGEPVAMSTRSGKFETLKDVVDEVGKDAARFIFLTRHYESPLDFDLTLAKKKSNENPVFYVQYVHARISSMTEKAMETFDMETPVWNEAMGDHLVEAEDLALIRALFEYPEVVEQAAVHMEPHRITFYLMNLASLFHSYYNKHKVITEDKEKSCARLSLMLAVKKVIAGGLNILGVSAPERM